LIFIAGSWKKDEEMGRQVLTGISQIGLQRCTSLPSNCNITYADVAKSLSDGKTLESEMKVCYPTDLKKFRKQNIL